MTKLGVRSGPSVATPIQMADILLFDSRSAGTDGSFPRTWPIGGMVLAVGVDILWISLIVLEQREGADNGATMIHEDDHRVAIRIPFEPGPETSAEYQAILPLRLVTSTVTPSLNESLGSTLPVCNWRPPRNRSNRLATP